MFTNVPFPAIFIAMSNKKRVFSGIQPSGDLHIGNYLGAIVNWVRGQDAHDNIFCIVDLHAITVPQDPNKLKANTMELAKVLLASGIDPKKSTLFVQSERPEHSEMAWILNCFTRMGELKKMIQYKQKSGLDVNLHVLRKFVQEKIREELVKNYKLPSQEGPFDGLKMELTIQKQLDQIVNKGLVDDILDGVIDKLEGVSTVGLFDYPVLMAGDILLYDTEEVPVGEDQKQHVEIARDIAQRLNKRVGKVVVVPQPVIKKEGARIMSLTDPTKKMSKSDQNENSYVLLRDDAETIRKKFARAVTDSDNKIKFDKEKKPGISNLLNIMSVCTEIPISDLEKKYASSNYGQFKADVAECVIEMLKPIQAKLAEYDKNEDKVRKILADGAEAVAPRAKDTLQRVKKAVGLGL